MTQKTRLTNGPRPRRHGVLMRLITGPTSGRISTKRSMCLVACLPVNLVPWAPVVAEARAQCQLVRDHLARRRLQRHVSRARCTRASQLSGSGWASKIPIALGPAALWLKSNGRSCGTPKQSRNSWSVRMGASVSRLPSARASSSSVPPPLSPPQRLTLGTSAHAQQQLPHRGHRRGQLPERRPLWALAVSRRRVRERGLGRMGKRRRPWMTAHVCRRLRLARPASPHARCSWRRS